MKLTLAPRNPPRLAIRTLVATSVAIGLVLVSVFVVLSMDAQRRITGAAVDTLESAQRIFADLEQQRQQDVLVKLNALAENPGLSAAVAAFRPGEGATAPSGLQRELDRLASQLGADALVVTDAEDRVIASAGPRRAAWLPETFLHSDGTPVRRTRVRRAGRIAGPRARSHAPALVRPHGRRDHASGVPADRFHQDSFGATVFHPR